MHYIRDYLAGKKVSVQNIQWYPTKELFSIQRDTATQRDKDIFLIITDFHEGESGYLSIHYTELYFENGDLWCKIQSSWMGEYRMPVRFGHDVDSIMEKENIDILPRDIWNIVLLYSEGTSTWHNIMLDFNDQVDADLLIYPEGHEFWN